MTKMWKFAAGAAILFVIGGIYGESGERLDPDRIKTTARLNTTLTEESSRAVGQVQDTLSLEKPTPSAPPVLASDILEQKSEIPAFDESYALVSCEESVKRQVLSPGSFDGGRWQASVDHGNKILQILRKFEVQNAFGVTVPYTYLCVVNAINYQVIKIQIGQSAG